MVKFTMSLLLGVFTTHPAPLGAVLENESLASYSNSFQTFASSVTGDNGNADLNMIYKSLLQTIMSRSVRKQQKGKKNYNNKYGGNKIMIQFGCPSRDSHC